MLKPEIKVDLRNAEALAKKLQTASVSGFKVGILGDERNSETGVPVKEYAAYNEYGTRHIPPRPFLYLSRKKYGMKWQMIAIEMMEGRKGWRGFMDAVISFIRGNRSADIERQVRHALNYVGEIAVEDVKSVIRSNVPPPLSGEYAKRKLKKRGHTDTLIDTGSMLKAVTFRIIDRNGNAE